MKCIFTSAANLKFEKCFDFKYISFSKILSKDNPRASFKWTFLSRLKKSRSTKTLIGSTSNIHPNPLNIQHRGWKDMTIGYRHLYYGLDLIICFPTQKKQIITISRYAISQFQYQSSGCVAHKVSPQGFDFKDEIFIFLPYVTNLLAFLFYSMVIYKKCSRFGSYEFLID